MEIETIFREVVAEGLIIIAAETLEKPGANFRDVNVPLRFRIPQAFAGSTVIGAEPRVGGCVGAVGVEGVDVDRHGGGILVAGVAPYAVELGSEAVCAEEPQILEEEFDRSAARRADVKVEEAIVVEGRNAFTRVEPGHDFAEITGQCAFPAERVHTVGERGGKQFIEALHPLDASVAGRQGERDHDRVWKDHDERAGASGKG